MIAPSDYTKLLYQITVIILDKNNKLFILINSLSLYHFFATILRYKKS